MPSQAMRFAAIVLLVVMLMGCVGEEEQNVKISITLPAISYVQAIQACNLTNPVSISLNNYSGGWVWELSFESETATIFCLVDEKGNVSIVKLAGTLHSDRIPLERIKIDEHAAFNAAIENEKVAKWIGSHNAKIDRISLESSPKVTLWRIYLSAGKSFLMVAVNATSGEIISVRGASFKW